MFILLHSVQHAYEGRRAASAALSSPTLKWRHLFKLLITTERAKKFQFTNQNVSFCAAAVEAAVIEGVVVPAEPDVADVADDNGEEDYDG